jgi:hypothetical protein
MELTNEVLTETELYEGVEILRTLIQNVVFN